MLAGAERRALETCGRRAAVPADAASTRAVEPHGRQPVLAGPLRRAARGARAARSRALLPGCHGRTEQGRPMRASTRSCTSLRGLDCCRRSTRHAPWREQWWNLQRLLDGLVFDATSRVEHRLEPAPAAPTELGGEGPPVARHLARARSSSTGTSRRRRRRPRSPRRRRAGRARRRGHHAVRLRGPADGEPDARPRLAVPDIGRRMERALQMLELLRVGVAHGAVPDDALSRGAARRSPTAPPPTGRRYLASIRTRYVLELLLIDETNPRSRRVSARRRCSSRVTACPRRPRRRRRRAEDTRSAKRLAALLRDGTHRRSQAA